jgi:hypothetical protein
MFPEDRLRPSQVRGLDPNLSPYARNVADAALEVVAENLAANALSVESLFPDVRLKRICGSSKANEIVPIFRRHGMPPSGDLSRFVKRAPQCGARTWGFLNTYACSTADSDEQPAGWRGVEPPALTRVALAAEAPAALEAQLCFQMISPGQVATQAGAVAELRPAWLPVWARVLA